MIQPSGFTYVTQVPNQVGLHNLTQLPNQVGLQNLTSPYMTEYYNFTSWVSKTPFHQKTNMTIYDQYQKDFKEHISGPS